MKKIFTCLFTMILFINGFNYHEFSLLDYFEGEYTVYTEQAINDSSVDLGFCYINKTGVNNVESNMVVGESMVIENFEVGSALKVLNAQIVKTEMLKDNTIIIYAYTKLIDKEIEMENKSVNLQIAYRDDNVVIGWPMILGSF